ncbi:hypothetical protein SBA4_1820007 [Candidatus Sulfopaludibacter sp. SbA4]|nr:hypothetical protein SBA4_1820007 [Candidatus Sulfopaludibacter sp. SbA4]
MGQPYPTRTRTEIRVALSSGKTVLGDLQSATPDSLAIHTAASQETLVRAEIKTVQVKRQGAPRREYADRACDRGGRRSGRWCGYRSQRARHSEFLSEHRQSRPDPCRGDRWPVVGVLIPSGGWHEIYRAP